MRDPPRYTHTHAQTHNTTHTQTHTHTRARAQPISLPSLPGDRRKKYEQLITAIVHERDVTRTLIKDGTVSATAFEWLYHMRVSERAATIQECVCV